MTFHTKHTAYMSKTELYLIYGFFAAFVICIIGYIVSFGGLV